MEESEIKTVRIKHWTDFVTNYAEREFDAEMSVKSPYVFRGQADES